MFHRLNTNQIARVMGAILPPALWTPTWERRTYGLFRGHMLLAVFVASLHDDCIGWERYYGKGLTVFMLYEYDVTVRPDAGRVVEGLKSRYEVTK